MRILLTISYDGTDFCGYQVQPNERTVQSELETALFKITQKNVQTVASGRTDSGVHALNQKVHFDYEGGMSPNNFVPALNSLLPSDIRVKSAKKVKDSFSARYSAKQKTYLYKCRLDSVENPLENRYCVYLKSGEIDYKKIEECCKLLEGTHDFKCFLSSGSSVKDTVRTIYKIQIKKSGNKLDFLVTGNGFLYNMVRIIVGTLLAVGENRIEISAVKDALLSGKRNLVGKTMPAKGLCLYKVKY